MIIRDILLHLTEDPHAAKRCLAAVALASSHDAHLTALYTKTPWAVPVYLAAYVPPELLVKEQKAAAKAARQAKMEFVSACDKAGVSWEWRESDADDPVVEMREQARYADLSIVGQIDPNADMPTGAELLPADLVLSTGRPVLIIPYTGTFPKIGNRVLVAWNGGRESARALHDALPLIAGAKKVTILSVNPTKKDHVPGADIAAHLVRHSLKVEVIQRVAPDLKVAETVLAAASDISADLVVMGAWGHSRLRELALGGATREMLKRMTLPVLMSH
jgi:nucleotide-binding universal stress UspA family protein